ncbi:hypothetical protein D3C73_1529180 [compost metagenome]
MHEVQHIQRALRVYRQNQIHVERSVFDNRPTNSVGQRFTDGVTEFLFLSEFLGQPALGIGLPDGEETV